MLHELKPAQGSKKNRKRVGRGPGSGTGKTAGRGEKGQKSRSGYKSKRHFEGGQNPMARRLPKRGFVNIFSTRYAVVNLRDLEGFEKDTEVTPELLLETGIVSKLMDGVKVLGTGEIKNALKLKVHAISASAKTKVEKAGGSVEVIGK